MGPNSHTFCCFEFSEVSFCLLQHNAVHPWLPPGNVASGVPMDVSVLGTRLQEGVNAGVVLNKPRTPWQVGERHIENHCGSYSHGRTLSREKENQV